ncbi:MAG: hypothetical protein QNJ18_02085 [Xenococcaceae cyanobacterium MO_167.B52]|nr:hypothetical protein [Xenococcaceae cyanobacterium MO_167.B52]
MHKLCSNTFATKEEVFFTNTEDIDNITANLSEWIDEGIMFESL